MKCLSVVLKSHLLASRFKDRYLAKDGLLKVSVHLKYLLSMQVTHLGPKFGPRICRQHWHVKEEGKVGPSVDVFVAGFWV